MKGLARLKLLDTYETERKHIATQLINFDAEFAKAFTQRTNLDDNHIVRSLAGKGLKNIRGRRELRSVGEVASIGGHQPSLSSESSDSFPKERKHMAPECYVLVLIPL